MYSQDIGMEFYIEKMSCEKRERMEGIELPDQEKLICFEKGKMTSTWEYWERTASNKWR